MTDIETTKGSCIHAQAVWRNEDGTPIDLTGRELLVTEAYPPDLTAAALVATDAVSGVSELRITEALAATLRSGRVNWVRLGMRLPNGCLDTSDKLWINVQ